MRHHTHYVRHKRGGDSPYAGGSSFMEGMSEKVASGMGTVGFLIVSTAIILAWVFSTTSSRFLIGLLAWAAPRQGIRSGAVHPAEPDLPAVAFYTGALVIIAQKAQTRTDRANEEANAAHREELAQFQTQLLQQNTDLTKEVHELAQRLQGLTEDVHSATCPPTGEASL